MTVKELLTNISFDELLPILKKYATDHIHDIYIFREVYDILKNIEPNDDYHDEVIVYYNVMLEYRSLIISNIKSSAWENELAKDIVVKGTIQPDLHEVAMRCLWNLTMYSSSPIKRDDTIDKMFNINNPTLHYEKALNKLDERIWKHLPRRYRYWDINGNPIVIKYSVKRMNRSKKKRLYRQKQREEYLELMATREALVSYLSSSESSFSYKDVEFLFHIKDHSRYEYISVTYGKDNRMNYILQSMIKYQRNNWKNYDSAIILIRTSPKFPIDKLELELFKNNIYQLMGHNNILVGNIEKDYPHAEAIVMLLLIKL